MILYMKLITTTTQNVKTKHYFSFTVLWIYETVTGTPFFIVLIETQPGMYVSHNIQSTSFSKLSNQLNIFSHPT